MLDSTTALHPALGVAATGLHVVTVTDHATESLYGALLSSGQQVLRLDSEASLGDLANELIQNRPQERFHSLHLYSHGEHGEFWIGQTQINSDTITGLKEQLGILSSALTDEGDILIYGCDLASGGSGQNLVQALASLTGADVAASIDKSGSGNAGANWALEYSWGAIETDSQDIHLQLDWQGTLAVSPGEWVNTANYFDANGDRVAISLTGGGFFQLSLAGGATDGADATALILKDLSSSSDLAITVTPERLTINAGSIDDGAGGLYNRLYSPGYTTINKISAESGSTSIGSIRLSSTIVNQLSLEDLAIDSIILDTGYTTFTDRVNTSSPGNINISKPSITIENVTAAAELEVFDESPTGTGNNSYNPVTGLVDVGSITAHSIGTLAVNGAISAATADPYDPLPITNNIRGIIEVTTSIGRIEAQRSALTGTIRAASIDAINIGLVQGEITTTAAAKQLTIKLDSQFRGFINAAGHLNLGFNFNYIQPNSTPPEKEVIFGEIHAGGGISGTASSLDDALLLPNNIYNLYRHTGSALTNLGASALGQTISNGIADVHFNGSGNARLISEGDIGDITANNFTAAMIVEAKRDIGKIEAYLFSEVAPPEPIFPPEPPVATELAGHFQAGRNIASIKSATSILANLRAGGSIGNITALTGGIDSTLIDANTNIGNIWAYNQAEANTGKIVAQQGSIGDVYLGTGIWGSSLRAGQDIGAIYIEKGKLERVSFAAGRDIKSITVKGADAITGGTIAAGRAIGGITVSAGTGNGISGVLIQAGDEDGQVNGEGIASIGAIRVTAYGATLLEPIEPGPTQQPARLTNAIQNSQIIAGSIGPILARSFTGSGVIDTVIHAQQGNIARLQGTGNIDGLRRVNAVAEGNIGAITGLSQVQGDGISESKFFANGTLPNTGSIGLITGRGGVAGGAGIFASYVQSAAQTSGITATSNANGGHAIQQLTVNAGTLGNLRSTVLGGEGGAPPLNPFSSGIVDSSFTTFEGGIGNITVNTRSIYGEGIASTIFDSNTTIGNISSRAFNSNSINASSFTASGLITSVRSESLNSGSSLLDTIFLSKKDKIGSITARVGGGGIRDHAIADTTFTAYLGIGAINANTNGGSAIINSIFNADSGFTNLGSIASVTALSSGINLLNSTAIQGSTFDAAKIGAIKADVSEFRGGAAITGSTFTAKTAIYNEENGAFDNKGEIGHITVRNASRTGNGIESSTFLAGAAGRIGNLSVDTTWQKSSQTDPFNRGASGKAIYLSSFRATGLDPDQAVMNGRIGNITINSGRVIPQILNPGLPRPNDQWTAAAAGIDLSYFAAYGGIGNISINTIGTAIFGSAILANLDPFNGLLGTALAALADVKPTGEIGNVSIRANGRFASGIVLSALIGQQIRSLNVQARGGPQLTLPFLQATPNAPIPPLVSQISDVLRNTTFAPIIQAINPGLVAQFGATSLFRPINVGLAPISGAIIAATTGNIGQVNVTNLSGGDPFLGAIFYAEKDYGPVSTTAQARKNILDIAAETGLVLLGYRRANVFTRHLSVFIGRQRPGGNLPRTGSLI